MRIFSLLSAFLLMLISFVLVLIFGFFIIIIKSLIKIVKNEDLAKYFFTVAIGNDQSGGAVLYEAEDWTISSRTYYYHSLGIKKATIFMKFIDGLVQILVYIPYKMGYMSDEEDLRQKEHCKNSYLNEKQELKREYEKGVK